MNVVGIEATSEFFPAAALVRLPVDGDQ